jgi:hypothetical protein
MLRETRPLGYEPEGPNRSGLGVQRWTRDFPYAFRRVICATIRM